MKKNKRDRILFAVDSDMKADIEQMSTILRVSMSEVLRQGAEMMKIQVIGKIPSSGLEMFDRIDKLFADKKPHASLVQADGEVVKVDEIVGSDKGWE